MPSWAGLRAGRATSNSVIAGSGDRFGASLARRRGVGKGNSGGAIARGVRRRGGQLAPNAIVADPGHAFEGDLGQLVLAGTGHDQPHGTRGTGQERLHGPGRDEQGLAAVRIERGRLVELPTPAILLPDAAVLPILHDAERRWPPEVKGQAEGIAI